ncbi:MAG TPA: hypothetical protein VK569_03390 [Bacteroidota bacterium]|nr:hypothetical protein [Bacteroidota bacterium]
MISVLSLWLPILLSAVVVFILSSLVHMVFKYHANDLKKLPDEDTVANAIRQWNIPDGEYILPRPANMKDMNTPEFQEKVKKGPGALLTVWGGRTPSMSANLIQWFVYCLVVSLFAAYVSRCALQPGAPYLSVFRFAGTTAFCCYAVAGWSDSIWYRRAWSTSLKNTFDGLLFALFTGGVFGWLWPQA